MLYKSFLTLILFAFVFAACSGKNDSGGDVVVIEDGYGSAAKAKNEIVIDDAAFIGKVSANFGDKAGTSERTKIAADSSQINTMYDAFGNRSDSRCFNFNPRIKCILARASASGGDIEIFVYARGGEVKKLSEDFYGKILTLPAREIAQAAGIDQDYVEPSKPIVVRNNAPPENNQLKPLPSYNFPVQPPTPPQAAPDEIENVEPTPAAAESPAKSDGTQKQPDDDSGGKNVDENAASS